MCDFLDRNGLSWPAGKSKSINMDDVRRAYNEAMDTGEEAEDEFFREDRKRDAWEVFILLLKRKGTHVLSAAQCIEIAEEAFVAANAFHAVAKADEAART